MVNEWVVELPASIIVCSKDGVVLEMNDVAVRNWANRGGKELIGKNMLECHPESVRESILSLLESGKENVYYLESKGIRKLIYQTPWYKDGQYQGFVSLALAMPKNIPLVERDKHL